MTDGSGQRIRRLDSSVVNRIAAGEIIQRPSNALKELIENSIDAGATSIEILVSNGGLKLLQITDNGCGIDKEDLHILCERHSTSKIRAFEDLSSISTYGFRGEALSSISHAAHLTVTTRVASSEVAYRMSYEDGHAIEDSLKPIAGRKGTQISVADLFYNNPSRRAVFKNVNEEYTRILDVVSRYAVHSPGIAFTCKKQGEVVPLISTLAKNSITENISTIYGFQVANELVHVEANMEDLKCQFTGWVTNANYHTKRFTFLLFINNRAVESADLRKAIDSLYVLLLPKGTHPFVYLSLQIDPSHVDVNIHPTKKEVRFINDEEIIEQITSAIHVKLSDSEVSRSFYTQTVLPGTQLIESSAALEQARRKRPKLYEHQMVRTDAKVQKITSMYESLRPTTGKSKEAQNEEIEYSLIDAPRLHIRLASVREIKEEIREQVHSSLTELFAGHTFVGIADTNRRLALVQYGVKLYIVDYAAACFELFYQLGLTEFGNYGKFHLSNPLRIEDLLCIAIEAMASETLPVDPKDRTETIEEMKDSIVSRRDMLDEYFAIDISDTGEILSLPILTKGYMPCLDKLPQFIWNLGSMVDWTVEKACFRSFLKALAIFYVPEIIPQTLDEQQNIDLTEDDSLSSASQRKKHVLHALEHVLFPAIKKRLLATKGLIDEKRVFEVADLPRLYHVFERC